MTQAEDFRQKVLEKMQNVDFRTTKELGNIRGSSSGSFTFEYGDCTGNESVEITLENELIKFKVFAGNWDVPDHWRTPDGIEVPEDDEEAADFLSMALAFDPRRSLKLLEDVEVEDNILRGSLNLGEEAVEGGVVKAEYTIDSENRVAIMNIFIPGSGPPIVDNCPFLYD